MSEINQNSDLITLRPTLLGLAYRILGSRTDAEDAVQDTFEKWAQADPSTIENTKAWLTTVCTRRCLDLLRSAHHSRVDYIGAWLPEPVHTPVHSGAEASLELASSLTTAFLLVLERLSPKERAAYILYEVFDEPYKTIASTLGITEAACRKLVSRAKSNVRQSRTRKIPAKDRQKAFIRAFQQAVTEGDTGPISQLLSEDIRLSADGGGKVPAIRKTLAGIADVTDFIARHLHRFWKGYQWNFEEINGGPGIIMKDGEVISSMVTFAYDAHGRTTDIYIVRNPDKIRNFNNVTFH